MNFSIVIVISVCLCIASCKKEETPKSQSTTIVTKNDPLDMAEVTPLADGGAYITTLDAVYYAQGSKLTQIIKDTSDMLSAGVTPLADGGAYIKIYNDLYYAKGTSLRLINIDSTFKYDSTFKRIHDSSRSGLSSKEGALWALLQYKSAKLESAEEEITEKNEPEPSGDDNSEEW
jgi:hypothetical protein